MLFFDLVYGIKSPWNVLDSWAIFVFFLLSILYIKKRENAPLDFIQSLFAFLFISFRISIFFFFCAISPCHCLVKAHILCKKGNHKHLRETKDKTERRRRRKHLKKSSFSLQHNHLLFPFIIFAFFLYFKKDSYVRMLVSHRYASDLTIFVTLRISKKRKRLMMASRGENLLLLECN